MHNVILKKDIFIKIAIPYYSLYVDNTSKLCNHSFQNFGHTTILLQHFIGVLRIIAVYDYTYYGYELKICFYNGNEENNTLLNLKSDTKRLKC